MFDTYMYKIIYIPTGNLSHPRHYITGTRLTTFNTKFAAKCSLAKELKQYNHINPKYLDEDFVPLYINEFEILELKRDWNE
jgi:hypothetical protein